ncbi:hypothetical protein F5Y15DRAFT_377028 [Xylariaceae sp. FL0016]|nr:hypothetical protein F5Y15DRAFT_377028 [Xylariaceae sp. FL0016]
MKSSLLRLSLKHKLEIAISIQHSHQTLISWHIKQIIQEDPSIRGNFQIYQIWYLEWLGVSLEEFRDMMKRLTFRDIQGFEAEEIKQPFDHRSDREALALVGGPEPEEFDEEGFYIEPGENDAAVDGPSSSILGHEMPEGDVSAEDSDSDDGVLTRVPPADLLTEAHFDWAEDVEDRAEAEGETDHARDTTSPSSEWDSENECFAHWIFSMPQHPAADTPSTPIAPSDAGEASSAHATRTEYTNHEEDKGKAPRQPDKDATPANASPETNDNFIASPFARYSRMSRQDMEASQWHWRNIIHDLHAAGVVDTAGESREEGQLLNQKLPGGQMRYWQKEGLFLALCTEKAYERIFRDARRVRVKHLEDRKKSERCRGHRKSRSPSRGSPLRREVRD